MKPPYGFRYNTARDGLVVHEPEMVVLERIFRWAAGGLGTTAIQRLLYDEGIPSPTGARLWSRGAMKRLILKDIYRPHTFDEVETLVSADVAARLDQNKEHGIRWWNQSSQSSRQVSEPDGNGGRRYRKKRINRERGPEEWIAIPVPAYLPRDLVEQAQALIAARRAPERKNFTRGWELRGLLRCRCGRSMCTHTTNNGKYTYYYYRCGKGSYVREACRQKMTRAETVEAAVWEFVSSLLRDPERVRAGMEALIDQELSTSGRNPNAEAHRWAEKLQECHRLRRAYQEQQVARLMSLDELRERLEEIEKARQIAETELEILADSRERVESLQQDRDAMLEQMSDMLPEALDSLQAEERAELYRMLRLQVTPTEEGFAVSGAICTSVPSS